jgi:outer membrane receptor for ferric coprogen and ferric-rhodotorulic acid
MSYSSYWLTDMGISYPFGNGIRLSANVNNVFDKKYSNQAIYGTQRVPGMPRNFMVSIAYSL